jgi:hypothetical protein
MFPLIDAFYIWIFLIDTILHLLLISLFRLALLQFYLGLSPNHFFELELHGENDLLYHNLHHLSLPLQLRHYVVLESQILLSDLRNHQTRS